jgi:hypothetical protein
VLHRLNEWDSRALPQREFKVWGNRNHKDNPAKRLETHRVKRSQTTFVDHLVKANLKTNPDSYFWAHLHNKYAN